MAYNADSEAYTWSLNEGVFGGSVDGSSTYGFVESASFLHLADLRIWKGKQLDISAFNLDEVQDWNYPYKTDGAGLPRGPRRRRGRRTGGILPDDGFVCNNDEPPCEVDDPPAAVPDTSFTLKWWHPPQPHLPLFGYSRAEWAALTGDPHITGAHGDHADIKGADGGIYSLLSTQRLSLAVRFEHDDFTTPYSKQLVHGSWVRAAFWVLRLRSGELAARRVRCAPQGKAELEVLGGGGRRVSAHTLGRAARPTRTWAARSSTSAAAWASRSTRRSTFSPCATGGG